MHPLHNPYSNYSSEYQGGESSSSSSSAAADRSVENVERYTMLPPILGPDQNPSRSSERPPYRSRHEPAQEGASSSSNREQQHEG
jgi:hypothetical protein